MWRSVWLVAWLLAALFSVACKDEKDPVDIPFDGIDVGDSDGKGKPAPQPTSSASAKSDKPAPRPGGGFGAGSISGCCAALSSKSLRSREAGAKAMYKQAASVCYAKSKLVAQGKLDRAAALSQVRSSLLGSAPAACR